MYCTSLAGDNTGRADDNVYVIRGDCAPYNDHLPRFADLADQIARTLRHATAEYLISILRTPDHVILQIEDRVRAMPVLRQPLIVVGMELSC